MSGCMCSKCRYQHQQRFSKKKFNYQCFSNCSSIGPENEQGRRSLFVNQKYYSCCKCRDDDDNNDGFMPPKLNKLIGLAWVEDPYGLCENPPVMEEICCGHPAKIEQKFNEIMSKLRCISNPDDVPQLLPKTPETSSFSKGISVRKSESDGPGLTQKPEVSDMKEKANFPEMNEKLIVPETKAKPSAAEYKKHAAIDKSLFLDQVSFTNTKMDSISLVETAMQNDDRNASRFNLWLQRFIALLIICFAILLIIIIYKDYFMKKKCGFLCYRFH